jgi:hypothetical protein
MEDVNQHYQIVRIVGKWENSAIELLNGYRRVGACTYLDACGVKTRSTVDDRTGKRAVPASDIEQRLRVAGEHLGDVLRQGPYPTSEDQSAVEVGGDA